MNVTNVSNGTIFSDKIIPFAKTLGKTISILAIGIIAAFAIVYVCSILYRSTKPKKAKPLPQHPKFKLDDLPGITKRLKDKILGQDDAIDAVMDALTRHAAGLSNKAKTIGNFLFVGSTGVGKTQLAKELAKELFGSEEALIRLDMNLYKEEVSVTRLIGSSPGYHNHDAGGQLTEQLKKKKDCIILLDEIEKGHENVQTIFLQLLDEGYIIDAKGEKIDCRNVIVILTTNAGAHLILNQKQSLDIKKLYSYLEDLLLPEFCNRLNITPFNPISSALLTQLVEKELNILKKTLLDQKNILISFESSLIDYIKTSFKPDSGARPISQFVERNVTTFLSKEILNHNIKNDEKLKVEYLNNQVVYSKVTSSLPMKSKEL